jgi:AcrR family transcriptional regulator
MPFDPEATRTRIFEAAVEEFAGHGVAGARVERIAQEARANKESIYRYYGSKEELLRRVMDRYVDERGEALAPKDRDLDVYVRETFRFFRDNPDFLRLTVWEGMEPGTGIDETSLAHRQAHYDGKVASIVEQQQAGAVDPDLDPRHLLLILLGMTNYWFIVPQIVRLVLGRDPTEEDLRAQEELLAECCRRILRRPVAEESVDE